MPRTSLIPGTAALSVLLGGGSGQDIPVRRTRCPRTPTAQTAPAMAKKPAMGATAANQLAAMANPVRQNATTFETGQLIANHPRTPDLPAESGPLSVNVAANTPLSTLTTMTTTIPNPLADASWGKKLSATSTAGAPAAAAVPTAADPAARRGRLRARRGNIARQNLAQRVGPDQDSLGRREPRQMGGRRGAASFTPAQTAWSSRLAFVEMVMTDITGPPAPVLSRVRGCPRWTPILLMRCIATARFHIGGGLHLLGLATRVACCVAPPAIARQDRSQRTT